MFQGNILSKFPRASRLIARKYGSSSNEVVSKSTSYKKLDPNNYSLPLRKPKMEDLMEPYGDWNTAYAAEKKLGNFKIIRGVICLGSALALLYYSGVADDIWMPNLDNIIADTEHLKKPVETEGRITVYNLDDDDEDDDSKGENEDTETE